MIKTAHPKSSRTRFLAISITALSLIAVQVHAKSQIPLKAVIDAHSLSSINRMINVGTVETVFSITGGNPDNNLSAIAADIAQVETDIATLNANMETIIPSLEAAIDSLDEAVGQIDESSALLEASAISIQSSADELAGLVDGLATQEQVAGVITALQGSDTSQTLTTLAVAIADISAGANITCLGGSGIDGQQIDVSYIYSDFRSLGAGLSDISSISSQFTSTNSLITNLGSSALATSTQAATIISNISALPTVANVSDVTATTATNITAATNATSYLGVALADLPTNSELATALLPLATTAQLTSAGTVSAIQSGLATSNQLTSAVAPLATSAGLTSAVGPLATTSNVDARFSSVDSAIAGVITNNNAQTTTLQSNISTATSPLATAANLATTNSTVNTINNNVNSANAALGAIEGSGFSSGSNSLVAITAAINSLETQMNNSFANVQDFLMALILKVLSDPVKGVNSAKGAAYLTVPVTSADTNPTAIAYLVEYRTALGTALTASTTATNASTQSYTATSSALSTVASAITAFDTLATQWAIDGSRPNSTYSAAQISGALNLLQATLEYLLSQQEPAV